MRLFWLAALCAVVVVMAVPTPYVFHNEPAWWAVGWSIMLVGPVGLIVVLVRAERLIRSLDRRTGNGTER